MSWKVVSKVFIGRECHKYTEALSQLLDEQHVRSKVGRRWLQPILKAYVFLLGVPDVGFQLRSRYVQNMTKRIRFKRALDAGCGIGLNAFYLARRNPRSTLDACDLSPGSVEAARLIGSGLGLKNVNVFRQDITKLEAVDEYDLVYCIDVLEHVQDDAAVIGNLARAVKKGGVLVVSTPHERHTRRLIKGIRYESEGHVRDGYSEAGLCGLLERHGFRIKTVKHTWGFFGESCEELYLWGLRHMPAALAVLSYPVLSSISFLDMLFKNPKGYGLMVIACKEDVA